MQRAALLHCSGGGQQMCLSMNTTLTYHNLFVPQRVDP